MRRNSVAKGGPDRFTGNPMGEPVKFGEKGAKGFTRLHRALFYSFDGLTSAFRNEEAFRMEVVALVLLLPLAFLMPVSWAFRALLSASLLLVPLVELLNSAVEAVVDYISLEKHPLAKRAKDMASAAVFVSLVLAAAVWFCALVEVWPALRALFRA